MFDVELMKKAQEAVGAGAPYPGVGQLAVQSFMPTGGRRELSQPERDLVDKGKSRWMPRIFPSYATPAHELMASPLKQSLLWGLPAATLGGLATAGYASQAGLGNPVAGGLGALGALGIGGLTALITAKMQNASNEDVEELMRRLPPGATRRDLMSDPVYQADMNRGFQSPRNPSAELAMALGRTAAE